MLTSAQIRQQFLDFFREKKHTIVPSSSLMPDSPNLLFTNAGMNQFVPIFLGEKKADVSKWGGAIPGLDTRAADTQKCIRAGGKHNDLDDVGLDTYHHTFFEMLGNWSFGDYFKKEAIAWSWELIVERFKFPPNRVYATIYQPDKGDPSERDQEAYDLWAEKFASVGLDPAVHIVNGNKKDNFWMMGETGPCGPCSEIHIDLTPAGDTRGALVNKGTAECIEIWNNVFIQYNANPDGTFTPLPAQHVDTGMGFERLTSIIQGTKEFTDFANAKISNYETDIFRPIFDELEKMSGHRYGSTLPQPNAAGQVIPTTEQEKVDVAFRVIGDHIRTLSFSIADGIQPGNTDRNYVLRRILRRAVRYGRSLGFKEPFFYKLVAVLARTMGDVFPEIRARQKHVEEVLKREEEAFNKTLDRGIGMFEENITYLLNIRSQNGTGKTFAYSEDQEPDEKGRIRGFEVGFARDTASGSVERILSGQFAFVLYDTYGFPLDLTELMARERGLTVDTAGFEKHMEEQRARARAAQKKQVIELSEVETKEPTKFVGYDTLSTAAKVLEVVSLKDKTAVILDASTAYAEMGGQVGDTGEITRGADVWRVANTQKSGATWLHFLEGADDAPAVGSEVTLLVDPARRAAIQRHHTVTHLLHWALHEVVSHEATQKGSFVGPDKLTFDFNSAALTPAQVRDIERLVNERIVENAGVSWTEVPYADVRGRADIMQFFGDKYGETVRVVQIGGSAAKFDGYSQELCAGTHTRATGEIGLFRIASEAAIAAGVRRIEAQAGLTAYDAALADMQRLHALAAKIGAPLADVEKKLDALLLHEKELEKALKSAQQREAAGRAKDLLAKAETINGTPAIIANLGSADGDTLQTVADALKGHFAGVVVLGGSANGAVALVASVSPDFTAKAQAGKIIQTIAPLVGGKGGGKPDNARGGGKDPSQLEAALAQAKALLG
ncbi:MAG: alanine--tRNA ligase [Chthoniobacter sp.]|nr:alanine--tRNA ligase [Chthoniobacter sp.]